MNDTTVKQLVASPREVRTVAELDELPKLAVLVDNRWDVWRVTTPGRANRIDGRAFGKWVNAPWRLIADERGIFPFWIVWLPSDGGPAPMHLGSEED